MTTRQLFSRSGVPVRLEGVRKTYRGRRGQHVALAGIDCVLATGQLSVLMGPSGCGKTTLLNVVGGVDMADAGNIIVGDNDLMARRDDDQWSQYRLTEVGFVFQGFNLIPGLSALQNVALPMSANGMAESDCAWRARELLELVGLRQKLSQRPDELSGGEQQRVAVALALANDPPLILADEPTGSLDSENGRRIMELLSQLATTVGKTVLVATHDDMVSGYGHRWFKMRDGQVTSSA